MANATENRRLGGLTGRDLRLIGICVAVTVIAGVLHYAGGGTIAPFVVAGLALAAMASLVGRSVEALGDRLGASNWSDLRPPDRGAAR